MLVYQRVSECQVTSAPKCRGFSIVESSARQHFRDFIGPNDHCVDVAHFFARNGNKIYSNIETYRGLLPEDDFLKYWSKLLVSESFYRHDQQFWIKIDHIYPYIISLLRSSFFYGHNLGKPKASKGHTNPVELQLPSWAKVLVIACGFGPGGNEIRRRRDHMGVSENSVPLNPMVNDHYPYEKWLFHWQYIPIFRQTHMFVEVSPCFSLQFLGWDWWDSHENSGARWRSVSGRIRSYVTLW